MKTESELAQLCPALWDPMNCSPPGSSIHGIFQARVLEWVPFPSLGLASAAFGEEEDEFDEFEKRKFCHLLTPE